MIFLNGCFYSSLIKTLFPILNVGSPINKVSFLRINYFFEMALSFPQSDYNYFFLFKFLCKKVDNTNYGNKNYS